MKLKVLLTGSVLGLAFISSSVFASEYPVQSANNGIVKKVIQWIFTDKGLSAKIT